MPKNPPESKASAVQRVIELTSKESGASLLSEHRANIRHWLPSGITPLDAILGGKGFPCGRIGEIYGGESFGKTTIAAGALKSAVEADGLAVLIDTERSFDANRAEQLGLDPNKVVVLTPKTIEGVFESFERVLETKEKLVGDAPIAVVWDSMSSTSVLSELEGSYADSHWGVHARKASAGFRRITSDDVVIDSQVAFIIVAQERDSMIPAADPPSLGGRALKFHASYRLRLRSSKKMDKNEGVQKSTGVVTTVRLTKSKICPADRQIRLPIPYGKGVDDPMACFMYMQDSGLMTSSKSGWGEWEGKKYQMKRFVDLCGTDTEFYNRVRDAVLSYKVE